MEQNHWIDQVATSSYLEINHERKMLLIAGPCVIESESFALEVADELTKICSTRDVCLVFKASYDKANRTSHTSFRGVGLDKGLTILNDIKQRYDIPITSDVHAVEEVAPAGEVLDIVQIPAFLCRQTDLIQESARTKRIVNVKKGQFVSPWDMEQTVQKIHSMGNQKVLLTERGTFFGYQNLVNDFRCIPIMKQFAPVIFDITHSVQIPGGMQQSSGGDRKYIPMIGRAAAASGVYGIFMETHPDPLRAKSDAFTQFPLQWLPQFLDEMIQIFNVSSKFGTWEKDLLAYDDKQQTSQ